MTGSLNQESTFYTINQIANRPGCAGARYPWSKSTYYAGVASKRFPEGYRIGARRMLPGRDLQILDRLINVAGALASVALPPHLHDEVTGFHFSKEGLADIADTLPAGDLRDEVARLSMDAAWLHQTVEAARSARGLTTQATAA